MGKTALPDDSEFSTGVLGTYSARPALEAIQSCDTLFLIGSSFRYSEFLSNPRKVRVVQLDLEPTHIGLHLSAEVGLAGDYQRTLKLLLPLLEHHPDRSFLEKIQKSTGQWRQEIKARGTDPAEPLKPQVVAWELGRLLPENALLACDPGEVSAWWSLLIPVKRGQKHLFSGNLATVGSALPYAIAAQAAEPERFSIALLEEDGFNTHLAEFTTCAQKGLPVKVVIMKYSGHPQEKRAKNRKLSASSRPNANLDYTQFAAACQAVAWIIRTPTECADLLSQALSAAGPALIIAEVDPDEKP
jgi:pyruvate dehydrogenase (quinone)/pyruvate oxidase